MSEFRITHVRLGQLPKHSRDVAVTAEELVFQCHTIRRTIKLASCPPAENGRSLSVLIDPSKRHVLRRKPTPVSEQNSTVKADCKSSFVFIAPRRQSVEFFPFFSYLSYSVHHRLSQISSFVRENRSLCTCCTSGALAIKSLFYERESTSMNSVHIPVQKGHVARTVLLARTPIPAMTKDSCNPFGLHQAFEHGYVTD